jgi:hypothetical protein
MRKEQMKILINSATTIWKERLLEVFITRHEEDQLEDG